MSRPLLNRLILLNILSFFILTSGMVQAADPVEWPGTSLYHLNHKWVDQDKKPHTLSDFAGKKVVVALIFTRCKFSCPITIAHLKALDTQLTKTKKETVHYVLISLDPSNDTPKVLNEFAKTHKLGDRWHLFNGATTDVRDLSVALSMRYKQTGKGEFSHGSAITMLGPKGTIIYQGQNHAEELAVIRKSQAQ